MCGCALRGAVRRSTEASDTGANISQSGFFHTFALGIELQKMMISDHCVICHSFTDRATYVMSALGVKSEGLGAVDRGQGLDVLPYVLNPLHARDGVAGVVLKRLQKHVLRAPDLRKTPDTEELERYHTYTQDTKSYFYAKNNKEEHRESCSFIVSEKNKEEEWVPWQKC